MSKKERNRLSTLDRVAEGKLTRAAAAEILCVSERHIYGLLARRRLRGDAALVHGLRGRSSNRGYSSSLRKQVLALYTQRYDDFGPSYFSEMLDEHHNIHVGHETLRRWLISAGLWHGQRAKRPHRTRRPRRTAIGELVQFDGSTHAWLEGRGPSCTLLLAVDDASSLSYARFAVSENTADVLRTLRGYVEHYGVPHALYTDHGSVYGEAHEKPTDVARAMNDLGVSIIRANSPQAKGRIERNNGIHQDRLIKAMRLANVCTLTEANAFLENVYLAKHDARFARPDGLPDVHRPVGERNLDKIFCFQTQRKVANDNTIRLDGRYIQLYASGAALPPPHCRVIVRRFLDGTLHIYWNELELIYECLDERPRASQKVQPHPSASHGWLTQNRRLRVRKQRTSRTTIMTPPSR